MVNSFISEQTNLVLFFTIGLCLLFSIVFLYISRENILKVIALSLCSLFVCLIYLLLDAPDVAMTEGSIGVCVSSVIFVLFISKIKEAKKQSLDLRRIFYVLVSLGSVIFLFYNIYPILPEYGDLSSAVNTGTSKYYIDNTEAEIQIPAFVAAILASYRGFDTMGETLVVLIAGLAVYLIMGSRDEQ
jgi:multicomponent Na+:H+ antiporter subunit B